MSPAVAAPVPELAATAVRALMLYALAEFQAGHATTIRVMADGARFGITDDGRGHPLDKSVEDTPYLRFIYTHFEFPFGAAQGAPVQLQGIGMSLVNALCSELDLTVRKRDETMQVRFRDGRWHDSQRIAQPSDQTGISVTARLRPSLHSEGDAGPGLEAWLIGILRTSPSLTLYLNGRRLSP